MKKWIKMIVFTILLLPINIFAKEGISNYYIDMTVKQNGDIEVEELFVLEGSFNGYERIINYRGATEPFDGSLSSFNGSDLYNGDAITIEEVKGVAITSNSFDNLWKEGETFTRVNTASSGMYGVYEVKNTYKGQNVRIYNPSSQGKKGFYIKYKIHNMAIVHNDIAEVGLNLFTEEQKEAIANLEMHIHIPNNKEELRAWGHGPLWGETKNINKEEIVLTIEALEAGTPVDIRFVFDQAVVANSTKLSGVNGLSSILAVETKKAEEANQLREEIQKKLEQEEQFKTYFIVSGIVWLIGLFGLIVFVYLRYDKEHKNTLPSKYYREFPNEYGPEVVGYLLHKQVTNQDLSASILNLIYKKAIGFEMIDQKDYKFIRLHTENVTETEEKLMDWMFCGTDTITLKSLKKEAKNSYESFLNRYNSWKVSATKEGENHHFYESSIGIKIGSSLYCIVGFLLSAFCIYYGSVFGAVILLASFLSIIYFMVYQKRSVIGNADYHKWMGLKNFMLDFGQMDDKELPEIALWEKYLVYAVSLGCAKKLAKTMEIKIRELETDGYLVDSTLIDIHRMRLWISINQNLTGTVTSAISTANSARISNSSHSSSGGFGGGFSGGGGSFGGGGGGGRF